MKRFNQKVSRRTVLKGAAIGAATLASPLSIHNVFASTNCDTLRAGISGFHVVNTLDPGKASLIPEFYVLWAVFNSLFKFNNKMEIVPDLAERWSLKNPTTWEFDIKKAVYFHDGVELTAEDVKFTLDRTRDSAFKSPHKSKFDSVKEVRVTGTHTIEIETNEPFAPLLSYLTNTRTGSQIVPKHVLEKTNADEFAKNPLGTGAFKISGQKPNESVSLVAHKKYFDGAPAVQNVEMPLIEEEASSVTAILGGAIDLTSTAPFADVRDLSKNNEINVLKTAGINTRFVELNHRDAPFDDVHFRRAVSMAFDRQVMVDVTIFGEGAPARGLIPRAITWATSEKERPMTSFNKENALKELAKSKYGKGTEAVVLTWGAGWWKRFAEVFVAQVNETLGTKLTIEVSEAGTVYSRLKSSDFQASIWGWLGLIDPDEYLYEIMHTKGWRNFHGYSNPKLDELILKGRHELDVEKRGQIYRQAEDLMLEDAPIICCFESNVHNLVRKNVKGFEQLPYSAYGSQFAKVSVC
jgi:peptide/nickel transport system substrate-binding protein